MQRGIDGSTFDGFQHGRCVSCTARRRGHHDPAPTGSTGQAIAQGFDFRPVRQRRVSQQLARPDLVGRQFETLTELRHQLDQHSDRADAAGVQFTRNPEGLAGALWKIRQQGSRLQGLHAEELSHLCFGETVPIQSWLATHPPLDERIEAICPGFLQRKSCGARAPSTRCASRSCRPQTPESPSVPAHRDLSLRPPGGRMGMRWVVAVCLDRMAAS